MTIIRCSIIASVFIAAIFSCNNVLRKKKEIFHAGPPGHSVVGNLYFALYDDHTYRICNVGGIGQDCYSGNFEIVGDTITLQNLDKRVPLPSNRLLILEYKDLDSSYWKWKYKENPNSWQRLQWQDTVVASGDVYPLASDNSLVRGGASDHFLIRLDSLTGYRKKLTQTSLKLPDRRH